MCLYLELTLFLDPLHICIRLSPENVNKAHIYAMHRKATAVSVYNVWLFVSTNNKLEQYFVRNKMFSECFMLWLQNDMFEESVRSFLKWSFMHQVLEELHSTLCSYHIMHAIVYWECTLHEGKEEKSVLLCCTRMNCHALVRILFTAVTVLARPAYTHTALRKEGKSASSIEFRLRVRPDMLARQHTTISSSSISMPDTQRKLELGLPGRRRRLNTERKKSKIAKSLQTLECNELRS